MPIINIFTVYSVFFVIGLVLFYKWDVHFHNFVQYFKMITLVISGDWCKNIFGGRKQTESTGELVQAPWSFFFLHLTALWMGIFVKIKPNLKPKPQSLCPKDNLKQAN